MIWLCAKASQTFFGTFSETLLNLIWLCTTRAFSGIFSGILLNLTWLCTKASQNFLRNLFRNLLWNPVKPNLQCATHTFFGIFFGILLNLSGSVPKPPGTFSGFFFSQNFLRNLFRNLLVKPNLTLCHPHLLRNLLQNPDKPDLTLHQSLPEPSPESFPEFSPDPFPEPSPEPY